MDNTIAIKRIFNLTLVILQKVFNEQSDTSQSLTIPDVAIHLSAFLVDTLKGIFSHTTKHFS
jgi:hypothetical protein